MARVMEVTREELIVRREEILRRLGVDENEFRSRITTSSLTAEEWDAKDELDGIGFLLGEAR